MTHSHLFFSYTLKQKIHQELSRMSTVLKMPLQEEPFLSIALYTTSQLYEIEKLFSSGEINPFVQVRTSSYDPAMKQSEFPVRIGFFPVAANPFHWGHLLAGMSAIVQFKLDKLVYLVAGNDRRKPGLVPAAIRHPMAQDVLKLFFPLFEYSSLTYDDDADGETALFRFLRLNRHQKMAVWYLAGSDHYRRYYPDGCSPDTVQKIEEYSEQHLYGYDATMHDISLGFIHRGEVGSFVDTFLPVQFLPHVPFEASSTMIREALAGHGDRTAIALLPYTAYVDIQTFSLYGVKALNRRQPQHPHTTPSIPYVCNKSFAPVV